MPLSAVPCAHDRRRAGGGTAKHAPVRTACHDLFLAAYAEAGNEPVAVATWTRGRDWALNLAIVFLAWSADHPRLHAVGRRTLAAALAALPGLA